MKPVKDRSPVVLSAASTLPSDVQGVASPRCETAELLGRIVSELSDSVLSDAEVRERLRQISSHALAHSALLDPRLTPTLDESKATTAANSPGLSTDEVEERARYDEFFGVARAELLAGDELASMTLWVIGAVLDDAADTALALHEQIALLRGFRGMVRWIAPTVGTDPDTATEPRTAEGKDPALVRWRLGHLAFNLLCSYASNSLSQAEAALQGANSARVDVESLIRALDDATQFVRATTAAMWYASSIPRTVYLSRIRPLMDAASGKDHGFSGLDNYDFRIMRERWEGLAEPLASALSIAKVPAERTAVYRAAHEFYETVVEDNEQHTVLAAELVGVAPSLKYDHMDDNESVDGMPAVAALRTNTDERRTLLDQIVFANLD